MLISVMGWAFDAVGRFPAEVKVFLPVDDARKHQRIAVGGDRGQAFGHGRIDTVAQWFGLKGQRIFHGFGGKAGIGQIAFGALFQVLVSARRLQKPLKSRRRRIVFFQTQPAHSQRIPGFGVVIGGQCERRFKQFFRLGIVFLIVANGGFQQLRVNEPGRFPQGGLCLFEGFGVAACLAGG
ncbi:MAG TPA: hypothetical protein PK198_22840 [Saprospiraceae bacterium]|nr:hypothetical protein [Saprospiraceae bacterium]